MADLSAPSHSWLDSPTHRAWLDDGARRIFAFARGAAVPGAGIAYLDADGRPAADRPPQLFLAARMAHAGSLGAMLGIPGAGRLADHAVDALLTLFADERHCGWVSDPTRPDGRKSAYDHVHVGLAAASATVAGHPDGPRLLDRVAQVVEDHLWREDEGALAESFAADFTDEEAYRGANANMHGLEAFLAMGDVTGDARWHERGLSMAHRVVGERARRHAWLVPEHFDPAWNELLDHHRDVPDHPFRPFGATLGHSLEWARYLVDLAHSPALPEHPWLLETALGLAGTALERGWAADGDEGLVYTVDWDGTPVSRLRLHWPVCEGIAASAALARATGDDAWERWYRRLWDHAVTYFVDERGAWINELDADLREAGTVWPGRPDVYHCLGAHLLPQAGLGRCLALAVAEQPSRLGRLA
ncbi:AGE family epimerase/isomerase [Agilicoccus flavus]|uniref:AGE family epimerase/isomerase n=1 Tax=Agilicoccus flavus TaxID=2775968 RepID=UPI001CF71B27|nr:AGE family epimerase/isomerase [Agilicoccus flavus]